MGVAGCPVDIFHCDPDDADECEDNETCNARTGECYPTCWSKDDCEGGDDCIDHQCRDPKDNEPMGHKERGEKLVKTLCLKNEYDEVPSSLLLLPFNYFY